MKKRATKTCARCGKTKPLREFWTPRHRDCDACINPKHVRLEPL